MTIKAEITIVNIGPLKIEGLMSEDGDFGVAAPQASDRFLVPQKNFSRDTKALLGKGFQFLKWKTPLNPKEVNVLRLPDFEKLMVELAFNGNGKAREMVRALTGLSLHQLFCDAFGQKFEAEDRQRWLQTRLATKVDFRGLTDQLKRHGFTEGKEYARFIWAFQAKLGIESGQRDNLDAKTLVDLDRLQVRLTTLMECGHSPWQAMKKV